MLYTSTSTLLKGFLEHLLLPGTDLSSAAAAFFAAAAADDAAAPGQSATSLSLPGQQPTALGTQRHSLRRFSKGLMVMVMMVIMKMIFCLPSSVVQEGWA